MMLTTARPVINGPSPSAMTQPANFVQPDPTFLPMTEISKSPERNTFQKEGYVKRCEEKGEIPNPNYLEMYKSWNEQDEANLVDPEWQKDNMEFDLRSTNWILEKARASDNYAQNLYAAMCNMQFQKIDVWPILKNERWSASWRHAGGIIADMQGKGDYIDWYCSGIGSKEDGYGLSHNKPVTDSDGRCYVPEGTVTEEIDKDLRKLGWMPVEWEDE